MKIGTMIAIYFLTWWIVLFAVLPLKVRTQGEAGDVVSGTPSSAPAKPAILVKFAITTVVAAIVFAGLMGVLNSGLGLDDIPFFPQYKTH
jgi:predicted secreted protein